MTERLLNAIVAVLESADPFDTPFGDCVLVDGSAIEELREALGEYQEA